MFSFSIYDLIWLLLNTKCLVICSYHTLKVMAILLQSDQQPKPWAWLHAQNSFGEKGHSGNLKQVTLHFNRNLSCKWCTGLQGGEPRGRLVTDPQLLQNGINSRDFSQEFESELIPMGLEMPALRSSWQETEMEVTPFFGLYLFSA